MVKKGLCLENKPNWRRGTENMGHYRIQMGFRRRKTTVARENKSPFSATTTSNQPHPSHRTRRNSHAPGPNPRRRSTTTTATTPKTPTTPTTPTTPRIPQPNTSLPGTTAPDATGPRIYWDMLLDTGATLPCLYEGDMAKLQINRDTYAAQSSRTISTADSVVQARVYELDVCIRTGEGGPMPVGVPPALPPTPYSESPPSVFPASPITRSTTAASRLVREKKDKEEEKEDPHTLNCTIPVIAFEGESADHISGNQAPDRLSGILPLHVCYTSSAPGNFKLWMGRERRDVLGTGRLPGHQRYGEVLGGEKAQVVPRGTPKKPGRWPPGRDLGTPERVVFEHKLTDSTGRMVRDEEDTDGGKIVISGPSAIDFDRLGGGDGATIGEVEVLRIKRKKQPAAPTKVPAKPPAAPAKPPAAPPKLAVAPASRPAKRRGSEAKTPTRKRTKSERADEKA